MADTIAHELSHQWCGNLVTMAWWDDLWLNEASATNWEYFGVGAPIMRSPGELVL